MLVALGVGACGAACIGPAWAAAGGPAGPAVVTAGDGSTAHRDSGGSATRFSLALPQGAACPGDSRDGGYRVQSFVVPAASDPGALRYKSTGPDGSGMYPLFDVFTRGFAQVQTANAEVPGGPGLIVNIPAFDYQVLPPGTLPAGRYHIGIACTLQNETVRYWSVDVDLSASTSDRPAGLRWAVAGAPAHPSHGSSTRAPWLGLVLVGAALAAIVAVRRRGAYRRSQ